MEWPANPDNSNPEWHQEQNNLADALHTVASAYESGMHFSDAIRVYLHELSLRKVAQEKETKNMVHCLWCLARLYQVLGNQSEVNRQLSQVQLITSHHSTVAMNNRQNCQHLAPIKNVRNAKKRH